MRTITSFSPLTIEISTDLKSEPIYESWGLQDIFVTIYKCHSSCETCKGPSQSDCLSCVSGMVRIGLLCDKCSDACYTCVETRSKCTSCDWMNPNYKYFYNNNCFKDCPSGTYSIDASKSCISCPPQCKECNKDGCLSCNRPYYALMTSHLLCVVKSECLPGSFANDNSKFWFI